MPSWSRALFALLLGSAALLGVGRYAAPALCMSLGLDWWNLTELYRALRAEHERKADYLRREAVLLDRIAAKGRVTGDLLGGRLDLLQAAARFKALNGSPTDESTAPRVLFPGGSEGEMLCRQVLEWARAEALVRGPGAAARVADLEAELTSHLRQHGTIVLPE
jgi:hypothetical protein